MEYQEALDWIMSFWGPARPQEEEQSLRLLKPLRMRTLLERLGSPHLSYPSLLVAGTKGKGSTVAFIAEGLRAAGYRVGRYTQPHLIDWCERSWVDGRQIAPGEVAMLVERIRPEVEALHAQRPELGILTTYEVGTAVTLCHFAQQRVEIAVLEIGIGGRLDALNGLEPILSVITSISLDHTDLLGNSLEEIAQQKAGIFRRKVPAISSPQRPEAMAALRKVALETGTELYEVGRDWRWQRGILPGSVDVEGPYGRVEGIRVALRGDHQKENAVTAIAALQLLSEQGFEVGAEAIGRGLARVEWPGRIQVIRENPSVVVDAAHNADSARRLVETLRHEFRYRRLLLVLGASGDKDIAGMAAVLGPVAARVAVTSSGHRRAAGLELLTRELGQYGPVEAMVDPDAAFRWAMEEATPDDLVLVTGSVFLAGRAIRVLSSGC